MVKIFTDLNCPFCFAQHERLKAEGLIDSFDWCYIEHAPETNSSANTASQLALLETEFNLMCKRSVGLEANLPSFCVNSKLATLSLISVSIECPKYTNAYRDAILNAYWREGLDISDSAVLESIRTELNLPPLTQDIDAMALQSRNQRMWVEGDFDLRIPAMQRADERTLLGLQHIDNIKSFIENRIPHLPESQKSNESSLICTAQDKPIIGLINGTKAENFFDHHAPNYHVISVNSCSELLTRPVHKKLQCVLMWNDDISELERDINMLRSSDSLERFLPLMVFTQHYSGEFEAKAFNAGASDVLKSINIDHTLLPRLHSRINTYQMMRALNQHAILDGLTGHFNKRLFTQRLNDQWQLACRHKQPLSLLMIDIDYFKNFNDHYGHCVGDRCLQKVAGVLQQMVARPTDVAARFGGEEFSILLPDTKLTGAQAVAEKIHSAIKALSIEHPKSQTSSQVTISMGVTTTLPHADVKPQAFIEFADKLLYEAKGSGRNKSVSGEMAAPCYD